MKYLLFITTFFLTACPNKDNLVWYNNQIIMNISKNIDNQNEFNISIGIHAQMFYLYQDTKEFKNLYKKLDDSFKNKIKVNIGIEKSSNKILAVKYINE